MKIKIPSSACSDQVAWNFEKSGIFSVRSAYSLAMRTELGEGVVSSEKIGYLSLQTMGFAKLSFKKLTSQNCQSKHVYFVLVAIIPI